MADAEPKLTVHFERLGRNTDLVKSYRIDSSYTTSTDGWDVVLYDEDRKNLRDLELEPVELLIDGASQVLGRVDVTEIGGDGSAVRIQGRDYIADLVECNVDPALKLKEQMTLSDALVLALGPVGIKYIDNDADLRIRNVRTGKTIAAGARPDFKTLKLEELKPEPGTGLYDFCNRLCARHGATIQPSIKRDRIGLSAPNYTQPVSYRITRAADAPGGGNNVISATAIRNFGSFPTIAIFTGKAGRDGKARSGMVFEYDFASRAKAFGAKGLSLATDRVFNLGGDAARRKPPVTSELATGALYRLLYNRDDDSKNPDQLRRAANRAIADRLKETLNYRVTLRGHADPETGTLWAVDTMVHVTDEICGLNEPLWIESRTFHYDEGGARTELQCWRPESFVLE